MNRLLTTALALLATIGADRARAADLDEIQERGVLRVAVSPLSPFVVKGDDGSYTGFEIDSTSALAVRLGVEVEYVERPFCELVDAIVDDEADIIASGFSNTPARRRALDFSLPYHDTEYVVVVRRDVAKAAKTLRGLNRTRYSIGFQEGGVSADVARGDFAGSDLTPYSSFPEIVDALKASDVDGAVMFSPYQELLKKEKNPKFVVPHDFPLTRTIEAFAMAKETPALRDALNEWIIIQDLAGFWDDLEEMWFDPKTAEIGRRPRDRCPGAEPIG
ncbi:MAG: ABC transporter substrate-binding protein [Parvularculaceae bacterium]